MANADPRVTLAINGGSSTVKGALFTFDDNPRLLARFEVEGTGADAAPRLNDWIEANPRRAALAAIGHRIVHGGPGRGDPQRITTAVVDDLTKLAPFAPNHLPGELALVDAFRRTHPSVPQVACFDTAFHRSMPEVARRLPIDAAYDARGIRRYGFHGISYAYLIAELGRIAPAEAAGRVVLAHLGNGSSLAAVRAGRSIDTTMAFTPIGGVVMGTRSGDLDPGVVTYLAKTERLSAEGVEDLLSKRSGLLGISGRSSDMRTLLAVEATDAACHLAIDIYVYAVRKAIGALAAALGGVDTIVFSGGIGEHSAAIRARACEGLGFLGVEIDEGRNAANAPLISAAHGRMRVRVIATDEELMIARAAFRVLASS